MKGKDTKSTMLSKENESTSIQTDSKTMGNLTKFPGQSKQKTDQLKEDHAPQGDLIDDLSDKLSCKDQAFLDLSIEKIKHFEIIQDFTSPTRSAYPIVIIFNDSGDCHCVDGWHLVQKAEEKNVDTIKCHVFYKDSFDIAAASIFKTALRSMPLGGTCSHAEMILNIRICFRLITGAAENPKALGHGGDRKGSEFNNNIDQKIIKLLVEHLGKPKRKIREYINHGDGLLDEIIEFFVKKGTGRRFFEAAQKNKSNVIANLKQKGLTQEEILKEISARMEGWYEEYEKTGEVASELNKTKLPPEETDQIPDEIKAPGKKAPKIHKHFTGNKTSEADPIPTKDQIFEELGAIIDPIINVKEEQLDINEEMVEQIINTAKQLMNLSESVEYFLHQSQTGSEREVA